MSQSESTSRVTRARLADGRDLIYFDEPGSPERQPSADLRELPERPATAEIRWDALSGEWISIATKRQNRTFLPPKELDPLAPQCESNPSEIPDDYQVAVFENRTPSFGPDLLDHSTDSSAAITKPTSIRAARSAIGRCEVVCFSPESEGSFSTQTPQRARVIIDAWAERTAELQQLPGIEQVFPFENRGTDIGVTLGHPHGQIYGYPYVPPTMQRICTRVDEYGPTLFADILASERGGEREILSGEYFTAYVPYAARWPVEIHLMPHRQIPDLSETTSAERDELSIMTLRLTRALDALYGTELPYIAAWMQAPVHSHRDTVRLHWRITSPRRSATKLKFLAGSESAMGGWISDVAPETSAAQLRDALTRITPVTVETADTVTQFQHAYGDDPDGVWSAPGRVNLIGEHVDYNGGAALPLAIDRRTRIAMKLRRDRTIRLTSSFSDESIQVSLDDVLTTGTIDGWSAYVLGVARILSEQVREDRLIGFDAVITSTIPVGVGVSSSHALECAAALALVDLWGVNASRQDLIELTHRVEHEVVGSPTGTLDQSAILLGSRDHGVLLEFDGHTPPRSIPLRFTEAGLELLVIDSMQRHSHATGDYRVRREECTEAARLLGVTKLGELSPTDLPAIDARPDGLTEPLFRRARHIVTDSARTHEVAKLLDDGRPEEIGPLLTAGHYSQRDDFQNSTPAIDAAVEAAIGAGALGARMTGGGFGGAAVALIRVSDVDRIAAAVKEQVVAAGHPEPEMFPVVADRGAARDR